MNPQRIPARILRRLTRPVPPGLWLINFFCQRLLGINRAIPWMVHFTSQVSGTIEIGEDVKWSFALSGNCYVQGINGVRMGDGTLFAPGVKIISANHDPANLAGHVRTRGIEIGKFCWIGANAVILPRVILGSGCIVGAGAVVTRSFPPRSILAGVPAKRIGESRLSREEPTDGGVLALDP